MNRLVLFSFYDKEGIADEYVYYLLKELQTIASKIVVIINGNINPLDREKLEAYSTQVLQRENEGYDAGAYKDALINYIGIEKVKEYDEVILCNDTFYGPFVPFKKVWSSFAEKDIDFWGLHLWQTGYLAYISSFFLVFRKKILLDDRFYKYWIENIDEKSRDIREVYGTFEFGLFCELCELGYRYDIYSDRVDCHIMKSPDYAIENYNVPVIKKKIFAPEYYHLENVYKALSYISKLKMYDIDYICENALRKYAWKIDKTKLYEAEKLNSYEYKSIPKRQKAGDIGALKAFCKKWHNNTIYIYGAGAVAAKIYILLKKEIKNFGGFIVSKLGDKQRLFGFSITEYDDISLGDKCIIVGVNPENSDAIRERIIETDKVIYIWK